MMALGLGSATVSSSRRKSLVSLMFLQFSWRPAAAWPKFETTSRRQAERIRVGAFAKSSSKDF